MLGFGRETGVFTSLAGSCPDVRVATGLHVVHVHQVTFSAIAYSFTKLCCLKACKPLQSVVHYDGNLFVEQPS